MRGALRIGAALLLTCGFASGADDGPPPIRPLPLGGSLAPGPSERRFAVYIPTRLGGTLTVTATSGTVGPVVGPDGLERPNGEDTGPAPPGWYTFEIRDADASLVVTTEFEQVGRSVRRPWNFYYWPTKSDAIHEPWVGGNGRVDTMQAQGDDVIVAAPGAAISPGQDIVRAGPNGLLETPVAPGDESTWFPNLYDDLSFLAADGTLYGTPSPLLKYDQLFRTSARAYEAANTQNHNIDRWPGHCLGGAVASILLNEPTPSPGSGLTRDELKALWAELGENHRSHRIGEHVLDIPAGPPSPGPDPCDPSAARFHRLLEEHVRGRGQALLGNLRGFPPEGKPAEVWNHGVGVYSARFSSVPGRDARTVLLDVDVEANSGSSLAGQDDHPRLIRYTYMLAYDRDGRVDESRLDAADWISVDGEALYAPLNLMEVQATHWAGHNPHVTETNVRALDLANGGGSALAPGAAPEFRPATSSETSSARRWGFGRSTAPGQPRRGGLVRFLGRR